MSNIIVYERNIVLQYHRGRATSREVWVLRMVDTSHTPALGYMEIVPRRNAATLVAVIQAHVRSGTIMHTDEWAAYNSVASSSSVSSHGRVNHSICFVDPITGNRVKTKLKRMKGCHADQVPAYLDEFMWRERWGRTSRAALQNIMADIAAQYPV